MGIFSFPLALADDPISADRDIQITQEVGIEGDTAPAEPAPPPTYELSTADRTAEASVLYVKALEAWKAGDAARASRLASEALTLDPELPPARMLAGYAAYRLKKRGEGQVTLDGIFLAPGPSGIPPERRAEIRRLQRAADRPYRRDQIAISLGNLTILERSGDQPGIVFGYEGAVQVPIVSKLSVRVDAGAPWPNSGSDLDIRGPRFGVYAVASEPLGAGRWSLDLAAGPTLWVAEGRYWADGWEPYVGVRGAAGVDVRLTSGFGLRWELGASAYPWALDAIKWYAQPLDLRILLQAWFGAPAGQRQPR
jgi:hypothetical protein